jgi:hypothetical protein
LPVVLIPEVEGDKALRRLLSASCSTPKGGGTERALQDKGRRVLRIEIEGPVDDGLAAIIRLLE